MAFDTGGFAGIDDIDAAAQRGSGTPAGPAQALDPGVPVRTGQKDAAGPEPTLETVDDQDSWSQATPTVAHPDPHHLKSIDSRPGDTQPGPGIHRR